MQKEKKSNLLLLILRIGILFYLTDLIVSNVPALMTRAVNNGKYGLYFIVEMFAVFVIFIVMLCSKNQYVFTQKKEKFFKSLLLGGPLLFLAIISFLVNLPNLFSASANLNNIITLALFCISIGLYEEFLCRGWVLNEFLEKHGKTRNQVITSIFLSSFIFGFMHISNIWIGGQTVTETIIQIAQATCIGVLLGSMYFRTKNIWSVVFLHGFYDFALMLGEVNLLKDCEYIDESISIASIIYTIILCLIYLIYSALILRKSKMAGLVEEKISKEDQIKSDKKVIISVIAIFLLWTLPVPEDLSREESLKEKMICYEYNELSIGSLYEKHSPNYQEYEFIDKKAVFDINQTETPEQVYYPLTQDTNLKISGNYEFLTISINEKSIQLDYEDFITIMVLEQNEFYQIAVIEIDELSGASKLHYSNYLQKGNISDDEEYLNNLKESFKTLYIPDVHSVGYITTKNTNYKYLEINVGTNNSLILNEDNSLYILK